MVYRLSIGPAAALTLAIFLFVPETYFQRPPVAFDGRVLVQSATEKVQIYNEWNEVPDDNRTTVTRQTIEDTVPPRPAPPSLRTRLCVAAPLTLWTRRVCAPRAAAASLVQIVLCLGNPLVFWVALLNAVNFGGMMSLGTGIPAVLAAPPYSLSATAIGQVNFSAGCSSALAAPLSFGLLSTVSKALTVRNRGVRHAEFYLPAFILPVATGALSVFMYGVAAGHGWSPAYYHLAYALNSFSYTSGSIVNTIWVTESLPQWAAPALGVVGGVSYMASWGITASLPVWEKAWGVEAVNLGIGGLILTVGFLAVPIAFWGKNVRQYIHGRWGVCEAGALRPQARRAQKENV